MLVILFCRKLDGRINQGGKYFNANVDQKWTKRIPPWVKDHFKVREVGDTNSGTFKLEEFKKRIFGHDGHPLLTIAKKIARSGIVVAASFPPAIQCPELIIECAKHYNSERSNRGSWWKTLGEPHSQGDCWGFWNPHISIHGVQDKGKSDHALWLQNWWMRRNHQQKMDAKAKASPFKNAQAAH